MFLALSTASCWDTVGWSTPRTSWSSCTLRSPWTRISRTRMRSGCARALKNSALKTWSCPAPLDCFMQLHLYMNIREIVPKKVEGSVRRGMGGATNSVRSNQPDRLLVVEEHGTDHEAEGHQPVSPGTGSPGRLAISVPGWPPCCPEQSSTIATSSSHRVYIRPSEARGPCSPLDHPAAAVS